MYNILLPRASHTMNEAKKPVMECVREFKLRQQYPSMITKSTNIGKTVIINAQSINKNKFHKIRLKLPSGKDLGECNVQMLPSNKNILKGKIVKIINQNKCKTFNKSVTLTSTTSQNKTNNMVDNIPLRSINTIVHTNDVKSPNTECIHEVSINIKNDSIIKKDNNVKYQLRNIPLKYDITNRRCYEATRKKSIVKCQKDRKLENVNIQRISKNNKQATNENCFSILSDYLSFSEPVEPVKMVNDNPLVALFEDPIYSVNTSEAIAETVDSDSNIGNSDSRNDHRLDTSISEHKMIIEDNAMTISHDNSTLLLECDIKTIDGMNDELINNKNNNLCNDNIPTATTCYETGKSQDVFPNAFQPNEDQHNIVQNIDKPLKENHINENASFKKKCSSCSILKEIMSIVHNKSLKLKALEAFADCGIETEQQIPVDIPKNTRTLIDTKVQTETDSLLESENPLKELYFANIPKNLHTNSLDYMLFHKNSTFSPFNQLQESDTFFNKYIDGNVINDICNKHSTANKVKEVLSQTNVSRNKIFEQLQRDFETVRNWDENGMLNIHKAVITDRIYDIQRHLLVLKACNVNVDIPTQSGMTSLELAIKYNVSAETVKLLLEAGANPASYESIHDSALIVASKINSPLLTLLINCVPYCKLLDHVDFTGFAALHYCAQYGNMEGINSLIKMGANVNLQESRSGRTPFFLSVENDHLLIAEKLIENGAQADIPNFSGQTVMSIIEKTKHFSLRTLLNSMS